MSHRSHTKRKFILWPWVEIHAQALIPIGNIRAIQYCLVWLPTAGEKYNVLAETILLRIYCTSKSLVSWSLIDCAWFTREIPQCHIHTGLTSDEQYLTSCPQAKFFVLDSSMNSSWTTWRSAFIVVIIFIILLHCIFFPAQPWSTCSALRRYRMNFLCSGLSFSWTMSWITWRSISYFFHK